MNWNCKDCDYITDDFNRVWNHCKGASHVMSVKEKTK